MKIKAIADILPQREITVNENKIIFSDPMEMVHNSNETILPYFLRN